MTSAARESVKETEADQVKTLLSESWLGNMYREILKTRTRAYHFGALPRRARVEIQHTLLGVELQVGRKRFLCPDLATARYLAVFAQLACPDVAVPYDITRLSRIADELESAWHRMLLLIVHHVPESRRARIRGQLLAKLRAEIGTAGPGLAIPEFRQSTKQRRDTK
jgi:hypothetical protein